MKITCFYGYADDNTHFLVRDNTKVVIEALKKIDETLIKLFSNNQINLNKNKYHLLLNSRGTNTMKIDNLCTKILYLKS